MERQTSPRLSKFIHHRITRVESRDPKPPRLARLLGSVHLMAQRSPYHIPYSVRGISDINVGRYECAEGVVVACHELRDGAYYC
jgi:hypothetical protein